jgi:hypothetical protein
MWGKRNPYTLLVGMQTSTIALKEIWRLLKTLNIDLPYDPAIPLLGIYPKECDTGYSRGTCTPMFIAALFTIAKLCKQPRCPLLMNGLRKCGIYTQWNFTQPSKWIELENIILSEVSQAQKTKNRIFSLIFGL